MVNSSPHFPALTGSGVADACDSTERLRSAIAGVLASAALGTTVGVVRLDLEPDLVAWLSAVGIGEGAEITVLRRAAFGGPIHIRTSSGGEFALHRSLALAIRVASHPRGRPRRESAA